MSGGNAEPGEEPIKLDRTQHDQAENKGSDQIRTEEESVRYVTSQWMQVQHRVLAYLCTALSDFHQAEDLLQEVASNVFVNHQKFDQDRSFTAWCFGIAKNVVRNHMRKNSKSLLACDEAVLDALASGAERFDDHTSDRIGALRDCVKRLTEQNAEILRLRYEEDCRLDEIATIRGISSANVGVILHRIRRTLADCVTVRLNGAIQ